MRPVKAPCAGTALWLATVILVGGAACKRTPPPPPAPETRLVVLAAEPLRDAFTTMLTDFNWENRAVEVTFTFGSVPELRWALAHNGPADVVALCDETELRALERGHRIPAPVTFARDEAVVIVPGARAAKLHAFSDLSAAARQRILALVGAHERDTEATVAKVVAGEAEAALVSRTALRTLRERVGVLTTPPEMSTVARCALAPATAAANPRSAFAWVTFVHSSSAGQQALRDSGLLPATP